MGSVGFAVLRDVHRGFDLLSASGRGDFSLGIHMGSDSIP